MLEEGAAKVKVARIFFLQQAGQASLKSLFKSLSGFQEKLFYCSRYFSSCVFLHKIVTFWVETGLAENSALVRGHLRALSVSE